MLKIQTHIEKKEGHEKTEVDDGFLRAKKRGHREKSILLKDLNLRTLSSRIIRNYISFG